MAEQPQKKLTRKMLAKWKTPRLLRHLKGLSLAEEKEGGWVFDILANREYKIWVDGKITRVLRAGVEYHLLERLGEHPMGQMFIGYESALMSGGGTKIVQVTRWLPGVYWLAVGVAELVTTPNL